jgi:glycerophosphoryl diester phosphodiesterase
MVDSMTFAEIRKLDLGARFPGQFPGLQIPTFDEALSLAKGKIGIYVDTKSAAPKDLVEAIDRYGMGAHVMFWSERPDFLKQISQLRPSWILMPEALNAENVRKLIDLIHPQMFGFDERDFNGPTIAAAQKGGAGVFVDLQTPQEWQTAIDHGVAGIQTDHPAELTKFLREKGHHR